MIAVHKEPSKPLLQDYEKSPGLENASDLGDDYYHAPNKRQMIQKLILSFRVTYLLRLSKRLGYALTPQLLRTIIWKDHAKPSKQFATSYLNGLRGITAVKVFTFHYTFAFSDFGFAPWGTNDRHYYLLELPIIRYFYAGFTSHVFFGIAGYLTSLRLFQLLDNNDATSRSKVLTNVSGSLFRRGFRLYLPVFLITLITTMYIHFGFYEHNRPFMLDRERYFPGIWYEPKPEMLPTMKEQLKFWRHEMFDLTNLMVEDTVYPWHDQHLWSILSEMRASLQLYGVLMATAQCRRHVRLIVMAFLTWLYFMWNHWETWVYILGAMVAQVDIILTESKENKNNTLQSSHIAEKVPVINNSEPSPGSTPPSSSTTTPHEYLQLTNDYVRSKTMGLTVSNRTSGYLTKFLRFSGFLLAFYLLSYPIDGARDYAPGYMTMNKLIPEWMVRKDKFYPNFGTTLLIFLLVRSDPVKSTWRRILNSSIPQYLGKISFSLYLVHGPIFHAFGYMIPHYIWWSMGTEGVEQGDIPWLIVIIMGWSISLAVSLSAADVWTREVESRCVRLVKALEDIAFVKKLA